MCARPIVSVFICPLYCLRNCSARGKNLRAKRLSYTANSLASYHATFLFMLLAHLMVMLK